MRWWTLRPAQSRKPATYRCPFCGNHLPALSEHFLIAPEGDMERRRHAHTACVLAARKRGELPIEDEWRRTRPHPPKRGRGLSRIASQTSTAVASVWRWMRLRR